jgi:hypothetical protein
MQIQIPSTVLFRDLGGEAVLLELDSGCYYGLDEVGTRIWSLLEQHGDLGEVEKQLLAEYDVSHDQLAADLRSFVQELEGRGLLARTDEKATSVGRSLG